MTQAQARAHSALRLYRATGAAAQVEDASPHQLIAQLLEGALSRIGLAQYAMRQGDIAAKGRHIGRAMAIVHALSGSLNREAGGELAQRLSDLYDYISHRLFQANLKNDSLPLDESARLLGDIRSAWLAVPEQLQRGAAP